MTRQDGYSIDSLVAVHPASAVTPYFIVKDFAYKLNLEEMKALRAKLDASLDETMYVSQIDGFIKRMEDIQVGAVAPDFTLPDVDGNPVTLSGLRGKYVLIDFWASWCPDCRKENPNIVAAWNKYKDKNFTILGVSLDRKKEPWLAAIEKDQLAWTHVSDLKDWKSDAAVQYAIRWIHDHLRRGHRAHSAGFPCQRRDPHHQPFGKPTAFPGRHVLGRDRSRPDPESRSRLLAHGPERDLRAPGSEETDGFPEEPRKSLPQSLSERVRTGAYPLSQDSQRPDDPAQLHLGNDRIFERRHALGQ